MASLMTKDALLSIHLIKTLLPTYTKRNEFTQSAMRYSGYSLDGTTSRNHALISIGWETASKPNTDRFVNRRSLTRHVLLCSCRLLSSFHSYLIQSTISHWMLCYRNTLIWSSKTENLRNYKDSGIFKRNSLSTTRLNHCCSLIRYLVYLIIAYALRSCNLYIVPLLLSTGRFPNKSVSILICSSRQFNHDTILFWLSHLTKWRLRLLILPLTFPLIYDLLMILMSLLPI